MDRKEHMSMKKTFSYLGSIQLEVGKELQAKA